MIDTATNSVTTRITGVDTGTILGISPDGNRLYVGTAGASGGALTIIDTNDTTATVATIPIGLSYSLPTIALSPDGSRAYIRTGYSQLSVLNTTTNTVTATISNALATSNLTVSPDGTRLYAAANNQVVVINTTNNTVVTRISGFPGESEKQVHPAVSRSPKTAPRATSSAPTVESQ